MISFRIILSIVLIFFSIGCSTKKIVVTKLNYSFVQHTSISMSENTMFSKETSVGFDEKILKRINSKDIKRVESKIHDMLGKNHIYESISYVIMQNKVHFFLAKDINNPSKGIDFIISDIYDSHLVEKMINEPISILQYALNFKK